MVSRCPKSPLRLPMGLPRAQFRSQIRLFKAPQKSPNPNLSRYDRCLSPSPGSADKPWSFIGQPPCPSCRNLIS